MRKIKAWRYSTYPIGRCLYLYQRKGKETLLNDGRVIGFRRRRGRAYQLGKLLFCAAAVLVSMMLLALIIWSVG